MRRALPIMLLFTALPCGASAQPRPAASGAIVVRDCWVRESTAARTVSSGYLSIENKTGAAVSLVKVLVDGVRSAEIHTVVEEQGRTGMRPVPRMAIGAHGRVALAPGGTHVMLTDITRPLKRGTSVGMTLTFDNGQVRKVRAAVRPLDAMSAR
jgi:copper(I)-binding protein